MINDPDNIGSLGSIAVPLDEADQSPGFVDVAKASYRQRAGFVYDILDDIPAAIGEASRRAFSTDDSILTGGSPEFNSNFFGSLFAEAEEGYEPLSQDILETVDEKYWGRILDTKNPGQRDILLQNIQQEESDLQIIQEAGILGYATTIGAEFTNPLNYFATLRAAKYAGGALQGFGKGFIAALPSAAAGAAVSGIVRAEELETVTKEDALFNFMVESTIGASISGIGSAIKSRTPRVTSKTGTNENPGFSATRGYLTATQKDIDIETVIGPTGPPSGFNLSTNNLSSAETLPRVQKMLDEGIDNIAEEGFRAKVFDGWFGASPLIRGIRSPSANVREFTNGLFINHFTTGKIARGVPRQLSAQDIAEDWEASYNSTLLRQKQAFDFYASQAKKTLDKGQKTLTVDEFNNEVGMMLGSGINRRNIPEIADVASMWKKNIYEPLKLKMQEHGHLQEGVNLDQVVNYVNRTYDRSAIVTNRPAFSNILSEYYAKNSQEIETLLKSHTNEQIETMVQSGKLNRGLLNSNGKVRSVIKDQFELEQQVEQTIETILGEEDGQVSQAMFSMFTKTAYKSPSPLKDRTLFIDDEYIQDFLVRDIRKLAKSYSQQLGRLDGLSEFFKTRFGGNPSIEEGQKSMVHAINEEYRQLRFDIERKPASAKRAKELIDLDKQKTQQINFVNESLSVYMGNFGKTPGQWGRKVDGVALFMQNVGVASKLGYLSVTMLTEIVTPLFRSSIGEWVKDGLKPFFENSGNLLRKGTLRRQDYQDLGIAINTALAKRVKKEWGDGFDYEPGNAVTRGAQTLASWSGVLNGSNQLSDILETISIGITESRSIRLIENISNGKTLAKKDQEWLLGIGIGPEEHAIILEQSMKHGGELDGGYVSGVVRWDNNPEVNRVARKYRAALRRANRQSNVKKGLADAPYILKNPLMGMFGQFMGWGFAANNTFVIPFLQRADSTKLVGALAMIMMGSLVYPIKQYARGKEVDSSKFITEAIYNSGIPLGWQIDSLNKVLGGLDLPILRDLQNDKYSQIKSRGTSAGAILLGPSGTTANDMFDFLGAGLSLEMNKQDLKKGLHLLPGLNNPLFSKGINTMVENLDLPANRHKAKQE